MSAQSLLPWLHTKKQKHDDSSQDSLDLKKPKLVKAQDPLLKQLIDDLNETDETAYFAEYMPCEVVQLVFGYLSPQTLCTCMRVSKRWHEIACLEGIWLQVCIRSGFANPGDYLKSQSWREFFMERYQKQSLHRQNFMEMKLTNRCLSDNMLSAVSLFPHKGKAEPNSLRFRFVSGSRFGDIKIQDFPLENETEKSAAVLPDSAGLSHISFIKQSDLSIAVACRDGTIAFFEGADPHTNLDTIHVPSLLPDRLDGSITHIALHPSNKTTVAVTLSHSLVLIVIPVYKSTTLYEINWIHKMEINDSVASVEWFSNEDLLICGHRGIYSLNTHQQKANTLLPATLQQNIMVSEVLNKVLVFCSEEIIDRKSIFRVSSINVTNDSHRETVQLDLKSRVTCLAQDKDFIFLGTTASGVYQLNRREKIRKEKRFYLNQCCSTLCFDHNFLVVATRVHQLHGNLVVFDCQKGQRLWSIASSHLEVSTDFMLLSHDRLIYVSKVVCPTSEGYQVSEYDFTQNDEENMKTCPFSSRFDFIQGWNANILLETPYD